MIKRSIPQTTKTEQSNFLKEISDTGVESAILRLILPFNDDLVPVISKLDCSILKLYDATVNSPHFLWCHQRFYIIKTEFILVYSGLSLV